jgi:hypothetical protein
MKYLIIFLTVLIIFFTHWSIYKSGLHDGEQNYKRSHRMYLALKSAYHFGWVDGHQNKPEDWDGNND